MALTTFQGLREQRWTYWVAQEETQIVSHIYIQHVPKVPKPNRIDDALGYVTNVYTRPAYLYWLLLPSAAVQCISG